MSTPNNTPKGKILLVDDDPGLLRLLSIRLRAEGYEVEAVESAAKALATLGRFAPDLVITDLRMDKMDGIGLLKELQTRSPGLRVVIITAHGTIPDAVMATQGGAFGFLTKPIDKDQLMITVDNALKISGSIEVDEDWAAGIVTRNQGMKEVLNQAKMVAATDARVLITGQSGTGKELLARAIHNASPRKDKAFVGINCSAMAENLLESELFGHEKGAFTGATRAHDGLFRSVEGGSLLLDEIGDMPMRLQVKLLRVLQENQVRPVGATEAREVDVRVISATHRDLQDLMRQGGFREDLYYRLNVVPINLPSLRERKDDIDDLAGHFLERFNEELGGRITGISPSALEKLRGYHWPGNVRELENMLERAVTLCTTGEIMAADLAMRSDDSTGGHTRPAVAADLGDQIVDVQRQAIIEALEKSRYNKTAAAKLLGLTFRQLRYRIKKLGIE